MVPDHNEHEQTEAHAAQSGPGAMEKQSQHTQALTWFQRWQREPHLTLGFHRSQHWDPDIAHFPTLTANTPQILISYPECLCCQCYQLG